MVEVESRLFHHGCDELLISPARWNPNKEPEVLRSFALGAGSNLRNSERVTKQRETAGAGSRRARLAEEDLQELGRIKADAVQRDAVAVGRERRLPLDEDGV